MFQVKQGTLVTLGLAVLIAMTIVLSLPTLLASSVFHFPNSHSPAMTALLSKNPAINTSQQLSTPIQKHQLLAHRPFHGFCQCSCTRFQTAIPATIAAALLACTT